jgi:adenylylsulfate kinase-like enzyme
MSLMENELGLVVILVGLPARGKSYIVKKLSRYLSWMGFETKVFNVGDARRKSPGYATENHDFFSSDDAQARRMREEIAFGVLDVRIHCHFFSCSTLTVSSSSLSH